MLVEYNNFELFKLILKNQQETDDKVESLQKAIAGLRKQVEDLGAEHTEDNVELKRLLREVRWISRERA
jgi:peptidoglycan hydrolase CwlO-like protein